MSLLYQKQEQKQRGFKELQDIFLRLNKSNREILTPNPGQKKDERDETVVKDTFAQ